MRVVLTMAGPCCQGSNDRVIKYIDNATARSGSWYYRRNGILNVFVKIERNLSYKTASCNDQSHFKTSTLKLC